MKKTGKVLGFPVHAVNLDEAAGLIRSALLSGMKMRVVTINPEMIMAARKNRRLAESLRRGDLIVPDGYGVVWALRRGGFKNQERVAGVDLAEKILTDGIPGGIRLFLLGGRPQVAEEAGKRLASSRPGLRIVGTAHGYFPPADDEKIVKKINESGAQVLLAGMGVPRQELWLDNNWHKLEVTVGMGVGGALDVWAGRTKRSPYLFRKYGLEWLYRALKEPIRFGRLLVLPSFVRLVLQEKTEFTDK